MKRPRLTPAEALRMAKRRIKRCVLCRASPIAYLGCYLPGGTHSAWYGLCSRCFSMGVEAVAPRIEAVLTAQLN